MTSKPSYQIRVSERAYKELKKKSEEPLYRQRGITGVIDQMLFQDFTTNRAGRPFLKKSVDK